MLEGLDQIGWNNIGYHIWGKDDDYLEEIPERIRDLSSSDEDIQDHAMVHVFGEKGTFGVICDTTPYIIPFVLEVLDISETPRRESMLDYLLRVIDHVLSSGHLSVHDMRLHLSVYDSFAKNIKTLISLLDDEDQTVQLATVELLGKLTNEAETLLPEFFKRFDISNDEDMRVAFLRGIKVLLSSLDGWKQNDIKEKYAPVLRNIIDSSSSQKIRGVAARASVETINRYRKDKNILSTKVSNLLVREFRYHSGGKKHLPWDYLENQLNYSALIIRDLAQLGYEPLLTMLENPENNAFQVHLIIRGLLASVLMSDENTAYWKSTMSHTKEGMYYLPNYRMDDYRGVIRREDKTNLMKQVLQSIVGNEKIWEMPTNMFSFFFGLPNSRNELRAMLDSISSS